MRKPNVIGKDQREALPYNFTDYKVYLGEDSTAEYPNFTEVYHWHDEVEFIIVTKGELVFNVNGSVTQIKAGNGIFVNSQQLHFLFSENEPCEFLYALIHPSCLCVSDYFKDSFVMPIVNNSSAPFIYLNDDVTWQNKIIEAVKHMCQGISSPQAPLMIQSEFFNIWDKLHAHVQPEKPEAQSSGSGNTCSMKQMVQYIQENYSDKISLEDIASVGGVSKSTCTSLFKKYLNSTPINYLIDYRLHKSSKLLIDSDLSITEIAMEVGFTGISYYTEAFRKHFKMTPSEYRKWHA